MLVEIVGWGGTIAILLAYFLVSTKKLSPTSKEFQLLNVLGAMGIIINSGVHMAIPSVALNIVWLLIALYALRQMAK